MKGDTTCCTSTGVTLLGYAGRDPDLRTLPDGGRAASFSLATTGKWKDRDGKPAEATDWHRIAVYGASVDAVERMVRKGAAVLVEGRLAHREFRDKKGRERQIAEIVVAGPHGVVNVLSPPTREEDGDAALAEPTDGAPADAGQAESGDAGVAASDADR